MELLFFEEVDSTNKYAKENLDKLKDKTLIYTNFQSAGRGRFQRKWISNFGDNIYASMILKPSNELKENYSNLTQYLSLILVEVFEEYNIYPKIKWPNDVRISGKKISGILAESVIEKNELKGLILGFGVNLNCIEKGFLLIREDYIRRAGFLNNKVTVKVYDKEVCGIAIDITENGALKLLDNNENEHVLLIGDIL